MVFSSQEPLRFWSAVFGDEIGATIKGKNPAVEEFYLIEIINGTLI